MKKRALPIASMLVLISLVLVACAPAATPTEEPTPVTILETVEVPVEVIVTPTLAPEGPVTITFWHTYNEVSPENEMLVETLIPMFEEQNPNIKVESLPVPYEDFRTKVFTSIAGGVAPDLARLDIIWVPELADMGALSELDELMTDFDLFKDAVFPGPLSTNYWQGNYYGLPMDTNTKVWIYNQEMYDAAGITAPTRSMDELQGQCDAIKEVNPDAYLFAADGTWAWVTLPWIWSFGGDITDPDVKKASGYLNGPKTVAAYEFWLEMYNNGCFAPVMMGSGIDPFTGYAQDLYANIDNGPWTYPIVESQFPDKQVHASPFPAGDGGSINVVGGEDIVLFKQSKHPEEAMEFIHFVLSPEYQLKMAEVGQIPVRPDLIASDYIQNHPYYGIFLEQLRTSRARTAHPNWQKMDEIITNAGQLILRGEMTPQEALDAAAAEIDALLGQ
jgi:multiple sugar transport system substrate-binding protein